MKKYFIFVLLILLIGCSSPQERLKMTEEFGEDFIYQQTKQIGSYDVIIVADELILYIVEVDSFGNINYVTKIPKNRICKGE